MALIDILACPQCKAAVQHDEAAGVMVCDACQLAFPIEDGIPVMLINEATPLET